MANFKLYFPLKGIHKGLTTENQPSFTSPEMNNVRPTDVLDERVRGGQRPGLKKWGDGSQIGALEQPVVAMCTVSSIQ